MRAGLQLAPIDAEVIDAYESTGRLFFADVLGMDWDAVLVTDLSTLSDFSTHGMPDELKTASPAADSWESLCDEWDAWVIPIIRSKYGIDLEHTALRLVTLFERIESAPKAALRH